MSDSDPVLSREAVMNQMEIRWNALLSYVDTLTEEQLTRPTDAAGWTVKDHLIHIAMWEEAEIVSLDKQSKRQAIDITPEIWEQGDDAINAVMQQRYHDMPLDKVMQTLRQNHERLLKKLDTMTDADLLLPYRHYQPNSTDERPLMALLTLLMTNHYRYLPWIEAIVGTA